MCGTIEPQLKHGVANNTSTLSKSNHTANLHHLQCSLLSRPHLVPPHLHHLHHLSHPRLNDMAVRDTFHLDESAQYIRSPRQTPDQVSLEKEVDAAVVVADRLDEKCCTAGGDASAVVGSGEEPRRLSNGVEAVMEEGPFGVEADLVDHLDGHLLDPSLEAEGHVRNLDGNDDDHPHGADN